MNTIPVKVNEARLQQFVFVKSLGKDKDGKPLTSRETRTLRPGTNLVPADVVEQMRANVAFMAHVEAGRIEIGDEELPGETTTTLAGMKPGDAVKLVQETLDKGQLEAWKLTTTHQKVAAAIDTQILKIDAALQKKE